MKVNFIYPQPPGEVRAQEPNYFEVVCENGYSFCLDTKSWLESDILSFLEEKAPSKVVSVQQVVGPRFSPCQQCSGLLPDPFAETCMDVKEDWMQRDWEPCR